MKLLLPGEKFAYERHFTEGSSWNIPHIFKNKGYSLHLITNTGRSELRVLERAKDGGRFVPRLVIENNFYGNLYQLNQILVFWIS